MHVEITLTKYVNKHGNKYINNLKLLGPSNRKSVLDGATNKTLHYC